MRRINEVLREVVGAAVSGDLSDPRIGFVGPVSDGTWNEAFQWVSRDERARLPEFAEAWARAHPGEVYPIRMLAMYCAAARRAVLDAVGPLDERFGVGMFEDDDYAHRLRLAGFRLACAEEVLIHHASQASFDKLKDRDAIYDENRGKFEAKWQTRWRPYEGDRRVTRRLRDEVASLAAPRASAGATIVLLAPDAAEEAEATLALARALARAGRLVFVQREPQAAPLAGLVHLADGLVEASAPLEAFEDVRQPVVVVPLEREFDLAWFRDPSRVVRLASGWHAAPDAIARDLLGAGAST